MNPSKSLMTVSILLVTLLTLFSAHDPASAIATELEPLSAHPSAPCTASAASGVGIDPLPPMAPGVVLVGLKPGVAIRTSGLGAQASDGSLSATFADAGVQEVEPVFPGASAHLGVASTAGAVDLSCVYRLHLASGADVLHTAQVLRASPAVAYAEPDYLAHLIATPNDPHHAGQWGLARIDTPAAWDVVTGTTDVVIAVVDAGLDTSHPDLEGQMVHNTKID